jgi:glutamate-ammonia-ligase adenylyltransferase
MLRIATRDLAGFGDVADITREISNVADVCLEGVFELCHRQLSERFGGPFHQDPDGNWRSTAFCVMGMGKLGGQELNYSSDVDVIFVYDDEGHVFKQAPRREKLTGKGLSNHQFFNRFAEAFIAEVSRLAPEGSLYRIDLRLRPEGDAGPLTRSLAGYENYYAQWGQTWERMMWIKARRVAGDRALAGEFLETIHPFRYPRSLGERVLRDFPTIVSSIAHNRPD